ncbi:MAG: hypothetical protein JOY68_03155 [Candidatus Dormibacteraeota bacterium]|nr:hypothetical protein [Candidatus Dormibacteraeota bacterium]MBV8446197.1 hypothetical protein [Candidatus Dormibacteraeota bacterium]
MPEETPPPPSPPPLSTWPPPPGTAPGWAPQPPVWGVPGWTPPEGWGPPQGGPGAGRFRALSLGELLDAVFSLYRRNFLLIAAISAVVQVPYALLSTVLLEATGAASLLSGGTAFNNLTVNPNGTLSQSQLNQLFGLIGVDIALALVSTLIVLPLATAATTRAVSDRYLDAPASLGSSYRAAGQRFWALVAQSAILFGGGVVVFALVAVVVVLGALLGPGGVLLDVAAFIAVVVLAVFVYVRTSLAAPAIVLERLSGWQGLVRSWRLVEGYSWRILGIRLLLGLITAIISGIVVGLLSVAGSGLDVSGRFIVTEVAGAFAAVFVSPITYIAVTLLYYDTRIRKEGFDIEMLARSL